MNNSNIYILDEKVQRQEIMAPYLKALSDIKLIYDPFDPLLNNLIDLFKETTLICLHNSFFEIKKTEISQTKTTIEKFSEEQHIKLVIFGGGIESISNVGDTILYLPVSKFYRNLEYFYNDQFLRSNLNLNILAFGANMRNEQLLAMRARLTYIYNNLDENDIVSFDSRTISDLKKFGEITGDLSLYFSATKQEKITRDVYLSKLEKQVQKIINE